MRHGQHAPHAPSRTAFRRASHAFHPLATFLAATLLCRPSFSARPAMGHTPPVTHVPHTMMKTYCSVRLSTDVRGLSMPLLSYAVIWKYQIDPVSPPTT